MRARLRLIALAPFGLLLIACGSPKTPETEAKLSVAAAANLTDVFGSIGPAFKTQSGIDVVFSYGSTAQLAQQIENGAPFDVFAAADTEHVDGLVNRGKLVKETRAIYAHGQLALWIPATAGIEMKDLRDIVDPKIRYISVAQPKLAPYGRATVEALTKAGLWESVQSRVIYANSISQAKQTATSGNAEVAFTAYSLVLSERGTILKVDPALYHPIQQALAVVSSSSQPENAKRFCVFLRSPAGQKILRDRGYLIP